MDSFEFNKIAGAVLAACLGVMVIGKVSNALVHPHIPEKPHIEVKEAAATPAATEAAPAKAPPATGTDAAAGEAIFKKACTTCHTSEKGGPNKVGPNLFGIAGNKKAHLDGFSYSSGMTSKGGQWTDEDLNEFLFKPANFVKGTKMAFVGLPKDKDRGDVIAFLKSLK
ncbi:cytochrome c family protein [Vineibacter terrae]|uniref:c-type cytochrome n=1 Tax=Vineibacter terrae TaxID=2586908 RepID=UPI002E377E9A|nr:cytochrome c family protein [Vineibacter terrae]HEX2885862.1 cytochrome c family protein [Vineibacter terrae]